MRESPGRTSGLRSAAAGAAVVFAVALVPRLLHLLALQSAWDGTHLFSLARGDAAHHWREAHDILDHDFFLRDRVFWKGPGYSYFLAGLMTLFGRSPGVLRWPMAVLGALNCAGLFLMARTVLDRPWALLAGLLAAVHGVLILYDGELFFPTLLVSLNLPALWLLSRARPGPAAHAGAGLLLGTSALVHPVFLAPAALLALRSAIRAPRSAAVFALAVAVPIAPVTLSNVLVRGQPLLISWNGGINLYVGNQPCFDQYSGNRTDAWARVLQTPVDAGIEAEYLRDRLYARRALEQAAREPWQAIEILLRKAWILLSPVEYASNIRIYELREHSPVVAATLGRWGPLWLPFGILGPMALAGLVVLLRRRVAPAAVLGTWSLGLAATIVLSFNTARYRAPLVFFGCIWVAAAMAAAHRSLRERRVGPLAAGVGGTLALAVALAATAVPQRGYPLPLEWDEAVALASEGAFEEGARWVERALDRVPDDPTLRLAAAGFHRRHGDPVRERALLREMLAFPDPEPDLLSVGHHRLARSYGAEGRIEEARRGIERALAVEVDATDWRGRPYYRLGLGPVTACWLRLEAAEVEFDVGDPVRGAALVERVRSECVAAGRIRSGLEELEARAVLAAPHLEARP